MVLSSNAQEWMLSCHTYLVAGWCTCVVSVTMCVQYAICVWVKQVETSCPSATIPQDKQVNVLVVLVWGHCVALVLRVNCLISDGLSTEYLVIFVLSIAQIYCNKLWIGEFIIQLELGSLSWYQHMYIYCICTCIMWHVIYQLLK